MSRLLALIVILILYGSLYPWEFTPPPGGIAAALGFLSAGSGRFYARDFLFNILFYLPVGWFGFLSFRSRTKALTAILLCVLLGTAVSATVEILQGFERSRRSSMADIYANALGSFIGAVGAIIFLRVVARMNRRRGLPRSDAGALALIVCWLLYLLFPFFPVFDTRVIAAKIPGLQEFAFIPFISAAVGWYVIGNIVRAAGFRNARVVCASSVLLIPAQLLLFRVQPTLADLLGAIVGATLFISTRNEDTARKAGAWAIISLLLIRGVWPLDITSDPQSFTWTPFLSLLEINWFRASEVLSQKLFLYGAAVWSLHHAGLRLRTAAVVTAALLLAIEGMQMWLARTPEITDPLLALMIAVALDAFGPERGQIQRSSAARTAPVAKF